MKKWIKSVRLSLPGGFLVNPSPYNDDFFSQTTVVKLQTWIAFSHVNRFRSWLNVTFNIFRKPFWGQLTLLHPSVVARCALTAWLCHHWLCSNPSFYLPRSRPYLYQHPVALVVTSLLTHIIHGFESPCHRRLSASLSFSLVMPDSPDWGCEAPELQSQMSAQHSPVRDKDRLREGCSQPPGGVTALTAYCPDPARRLAQHSGALSGIGCGAQIILTSIFTLFPPVQLPSPHTHDGSGSGVPPGVTALVCLMRMRHSSTIWLQPAPAESLWSSRNSVHWLYCIMGWWCWRWCLLTAGRVQACAELSNVWISWILEQTFILIAAPVL